MTIGYHKLVQTGNKTHPLEYLSWKIFFCKHCGLGPLDHDVPTAQCLFQPEGTTYDSESFRRAFESWDELVRYAKL